jgi:hypothetical protein
VNAKVRVGAALDGGQLLEVDAVRNHGERQVGAQAVHLVLGMVHDGGGVHAADAPARQPGDRSLLGADVGTRQIEVGVREPRVAPVGDPRHVGACADQATGDGHRVRRRRGDEGVEAAGLEELERRGHDVGQPRRVGVGQEDPLRRERGADRELPRRRRRLADAVSGQLPQGGTAVLDAMNRYLVGNARDGSRVFGQPLGVGRHEHLDVDAELG